MDNHEHQIRGTNSDRRAEARLAGEATLGDVAGAAAKGAVVGAGVRLTATLYRKYREGKNPLRGEFTAQDWRDMGVEGAKGGAQGGIAAGAIFGLTQYTDLAAPFAGAIVSSAMAFGEIAGSYRRGEIGFDEMVELGELACAEAALVGAASALGQAIIPIPVLGALIGAVAGRLMVSHGRRWLDANDKRLAAALETRFAAVVAALDRELQATVTRLLAEFDRLGDLTEAAFDVGRNTTLRLAASLRLAEAHGVADDRLIRSFDDMDRFMLG